MLIIIILLFRVHIITFIAVQQLLILEVREALDILLIFDIENMEPLSAGDGIDLFLDIQCEGLIEVNSVPYLQLCLKFLDSTLCIVFIIYCHKEDIICQFIFLARLRETEMYQASENKHLMLTIIRWKGKQTQLAL